MRRLYCIIRNAFAPINTTQSVDLRIIIDVFRASSTTISLLDEEVSELYIANDFNILQNLSREGCVVISEVFNLGIDNSPTLVKKFGFKNKSVALKTTNLTTAIAQNYYPPLTLIAAFNNLPSLVEYIINNQYHYIEIVPAGNMSTRTPNLEDTHCAEILQNALQLQSITFHDYNLELLQKRIQEKTFNRTNLQPHHLSDLDYSIELGVSKKIPRVIQIGSDIFKVYPTFN